MRKFPVLKTQIIHIILFLSMVILAQGVFADAIKGKVVSVKDGDTIVVLSDGKTQSKIRLAEIDAPEKNQPFGQVSKQALADMVFGKEVTVEKVNNDMYGRVVGKVFLEKDKTDVNAEMVRKGMAWVYVHYNKSQVLPQIEAKAKEQKLGLWSEANPTPPWEWRRAGKKGKLGFQGHQGQTGPKGKVALMLIKDVPAANFTCGKKKTCKQMTSCEEATYYLHQCGQKSLDGDGDGIPCNSLCPKK